MVAPFDVRRAMRLVDDTIDPFLFQRKKLMIIKETHKEPSFNCGRRAEGPGMPPAEEILDGWNIAPNGDKTCSYCGSLSEEDFIDILEKYSAGEPGYHFETTTKGYKWYAQRPGVKNASEGGIKFYSAHIQNDDPIKGEHNLEVYSKAVLTLEKNWREKAKKVDP